MRLENKFKRDTIDIIDCSFDIMSSVYFSRAIDLLNLKNDTIPMNVILDKEIFKDLYNLHRKEKNNKSK